MAAINDTQLTDTFTTFVNNNNTIKNRLGLGENAGTTSQLGSMAFMDRDITSNITIPANKRAFSIDSVVVDGTTVTVADGASYVVL